MNHGPFFGTGRVTAKPDKTPIEANTPWRPIGAMRRAKIGSKKVPTRRTPLADHSSPRAHTG